MTVEQIKRILLRLEDESHPESENNEALNYAIWAIDKVHELKTILDEVL